MTDSAEPPAAWFARADETPDETFYREARLVAHIDQVTIDALTEFYRQFIGENADVLDLMSSWISHLPPDVPYSRVAGLGMNATELASNPRLTEWCVQNLNDDPQLPFPADSFDRVLIAVSIQYLTRPVEVLRSARAVLRRSGRIAIAMSHRCFPTKAIAAFQHLAPADRVRLVTWYLERAGFSAIAFDDRSPSCGDPLWVVSATAG